MKTMTSLLVSPSGHPLSNSDGGGITIGVDDFSNVASTLFSSAAWSEILKRLLPEGEAWDYTGTMGLLVDSLSEELANVDAYIRDSIIDLITIRSQEVLEWWETTLGLPDAEVLNYAVLAATRSFYMLPIIRIRTSTTTSIHYGLITNLTSTTTWPAPANIDDISNALYISVTFDSASTDFCILKNAHYKLKGL